MSISAAEGNLGDIAIRREVIDQLRKIGLRPVIYSGSMGRDYVEAFEFHSAEMITRSGPVFIRNLLAEIASARRPVVVMAPGPVQVGASLQSALKHMLLFVLLLSVRVTGGKVIIVGRSVDVKRSFALPIERLLAAASNLYVARDSRTRSILGAQTLVFPDYALRQYGQSPDSVATSFGQRSLMVVSLRHDRILDNDIGVLTALKTRAAQCGYKLVFTAQVREDSAANRRLAELLSVDFVDWPEHRPHSDHEARVLELYSEATVVVSDRLHALLFAVRAGAVPVIQYRQGFTKLSDALAHLFDVQHIQTPKDVCALRIDATESMRVATQATEASSQHQLLDALLRETIGAS
ncbi:polysaccharide pyruvyl transferase family protein [Williamsia muralis]|uniref:Polysaccharide pyruvyl transferase family protein n=1 Tax=Williamsia marianensis TaxID=85044 RepID=A0ABU4EMQ9_WILMA|nr:polysaccharide pyruvyl transferase family protein [Williamsia muralis]MDV7132532.1 polysaccharide pyruvyl transferase family protein [Williamsia muralis]